MGTISTIMHEQPTALLLGANGLQRAWRLTGSTLVRGEMGETWFKIRRADQNTGGIINGDEGSWK
jgi:hypothetical protein